MERKRQIRSRIVDSCSCFNLEFKEFVFEKVMKNRTGEMWPRFGIKLGNSTICVGAAREDGKIEVIANKHGNRVSHAVLLADGPEIEVGLTAKQKLSQKSPATVINNFQLFAKGMAEENVQNAVKYLTCSYNRDLDKYELKIPGGGAADGTDDSKTRSLSPYQVCVEFFKASFELARQYHLVEDHPNVVLSIPNYYATESWMNLATAAEEAGFRVVQIIPEHTAAVLAYEELLLDRSVDRHTNDSKSNDGQQRRVLCIKTGGLLTSLSLFEVHDGFLSLIESTGPYYIGGKRFTDVLEEFISQEFFRKYKLDPKESRRSMAKIRTAAEDCKHILTTLPSTQIYIDSLMDGIDFNVQMSRARYEMLIQGPLNELMTIVNDAVETLLTACNGNKSIDEVVIIGGTMKIPKIQSVISARFPNAKVHSQFPQDEIVAIGCARQSIYADPNEQELESDMKCSYAASDIFISLAANAVRQELVLKKGTLLPIETIVEMQCPPCDDNETTITRFLIQSENFSEHIDLNNASVIDGRYRIKAIVEENDGRSKITLVDASL